MSLPVEILRARLQNEIGACQRYLKVDLDISDEKLEKFPVEIEITVLQVPGPVLENDRVVYRHGHRFSLIIGLNYPFEKPLVIWLTPIFHPNIMLPEDGGHLCTRLLSEWGFHSNLLSFIKGIESLLQAPNGSSPFGTDSCTRAAQYFNAERNRCQPLVQSLSSKGVLR